MAETMVTDASETSLNHVLASPARAGPAAALGHARLWHPDVALTHSPSALTDQFRRQSLGPRCVAQVSASSAQKKRQAADLKVRRKWLNQDSVSLSCAPISR